MNIDTLRIFCDVVIHQSFSRGATVNDVSQSAATQSIHRLEKQLGATLVDRTKRPFVLTTEGKFCYETFREILELYDTLGVKIKTMHDQVSGQIRVAAIYSVGLHDMSRCMQDFMRNYPKAKVRLEFLHPHRVYQAVLNSEVDLGIVSYPIASSEIDVIPLRSEKMVLACPREHPLLGEQGEFTLERLQGLDYIAFDRELMIRKETDRVFRQKGIGVNVTMEFDNIETIKQAVETGLGVSILPAPTVRSEVDTGKLAAIPLTAPEMTRPIGIIHRHRKVFMPTTTRFIELLVKMQGTEAPAEA